MELLNFLKYRGTKLGALVVALFISAFALLNTTTLTAQDAKVDKAVAKVCDRLDNLIEAVVMLEQADVAGTDKQFTKAYKKTVKAWNKFVKAAYNLESVEYKESVDAYNGLVDAVNLSESGPMDDQTTKKINNSVKKASDTIYSLQTSYCN